MYVTVTAVLIHVWMNPPLALSGRWQRQRAQVQLSVTTSSRSRCQRRLQQVSTAVVSDVSDDPPTSSSDVVRDGSDNPSTSSNVGVSDDSDDSPTSSTNDSVDPPSVILADDTPSYSLARADTSSDFDSDEEVGFVSEGELCTCLLMIFIDMTQGKGGAYNVQVLVK